MRVIHIHLQSRRSVPTRIRTRDCAGVPDCPCQRHDSEATRELETAFRRFLLEEEQEPEHSGDAVVTAHDQAEAEHLAARAKARGKVPVIHAGDGAYRVIWP
jgi:hypothetical protein